MSFRFLFALVLSGFLMSCKSSLQDSTVLNEAQSWKVERLKLPTIVFNWSNGSGDLEKHLSAQIDQAFEVNQEIASGVKEFP
jgi:hypothetical protein